MSVKSAMNRIAEADDASFEDRDREAQFDAYEKTLRALEDLDADDDDEGVVVVTDWIVDQLETEGKRPSSRAVRKRAQQFCRKNGYGVDEGSWLSA